MTTRKLIGACLFIAAVFIGCTYWFIKSASDRHMQTLKNSSRQAEELRLQMEREERSRFYQREFHESQRKN